MSKNLLCVVVLVFFCAACSSTADPDAQICCGGKPISQSFEQGGKMLSSSAKVPAKGDNLIYTFNLENNTSRAVSMTAPPEPSFPESVVVDVRPGPFKPGETISVKVTFRTAEHQGDTDIFVRLFFDSEAIPSLLHLSVTGP